MKKSYPNKITENAKSNGYKSANLRYLNDSLSNYESVSGFQIAVPKFVSLSHDEVSNHLRKILPSWENSWLKFVNAFKNQEDMTSLGEEAKKILEELRTNIEETFAKNPIINSEKQTQNLDKSDLLMVRSTGKEDSVELANPGGNESVPSKFTNEDISNAVGEVVASYFSEKSLSQRLKANNDITQDPFMPVLIQNLVGEGLSTQDGIVYSGVMYSGDGNTKIQVAPGHGELIVNSKGNFDDFYVTSQNVVYGEVQNKDFRLKPNYDKNTNKLSLQEVDNKIDIALSHSLPEEVVQEMHKLAQYIEKLYGMRMDVEFVYDLSNNVLNIVQARPIPDGDRANHKPSALDPVYIKEIVKDGGQIFKGSTITPEVNHAVTIDSANEIIICNQIEEALDIYLKNSKNIKAVVVKNTAPNTGHEAGEFSSKAVPVVQIQDIGKIEKLLDDLKGGKKIVVDSQRKSVFQLPTTPSKTPITEGIFKSALTSNVSSYDYKFVKSDSSNIVDLPDQLGDLITSAKKFVPGAFEKLANKIHENYLKENQKNPNLKDLNKALDVLESPYGDTSGHKNALKTVLKLAANLYKNGKISHDLFVQVMITGAELGDIIEGDLKTINNEIVENNKDKQKIYTEYLNVYEKLEGEIKAEATEGVISSSIFTELSEKIHENDMLKLVENEKWTEEQKSNFVNVTKLGKFFINQNSQNNYINFCKEICSTNYSTHLVNLVTNLVKIGIHSQWCNTSFVENYNKYSTNSVVVLGNLLTEAKELLQKKDGLKQIDRLINQLKKQVSLWKEPKDFNELHKKFQEKLKQITEKLKFDYDASKLETIMTSKQMYDLVDSIDLTIKSLEKSTIYTDKNQQAMNFKIMLKDFAGLMIEWFKDLNIENGEKIEQKINAMLNSDSSPTARELSPSGNFAVNTATIYSDISPEGWDRNLLLCKTLEDCFTLIHQNLTCVTSFCSKNTIHELLNELPETVKKLNKSLISADNYKAIVASIEVDYPQTILHYNIPLANHSAIVDIKYDCLTKEISVNYSVFGDNICNRWDELELYSLVQFDFLSDIKIIQKPKFQTKKNILSFEVKISNDNAINFVQNVIDRINYSSTALTFTAETNIFSFIKNNFTIIDNNEFKKFLDSIDPNIFIRIYRNHSDSEQDTLLHYAINNNDQELTKFLIKKGAKLDCINNDGVSPVELILNKNWSEVIELLKGIDWIINTETGAKLDFINNDGNTQLHLAINKGFTDVAISLIEKGAKLNVLNNDGKTPLCIALDKGLQSVAVSLVKQGAELDIQTKSVENLWDLAINKGYKDLFVSLAEKEFNLDAQNKNGDTPLHLAINNGWEEAVTLLIKKGAKLDVFNKNSCTPLHLSIANELTTITEALIKAKVNLNSKNKNGDPLLFDAIQDDNIKLVTLFIDNGVDVNCNNNSGSTALHFAIAIKNFDIIKLLINHKDIKLNTQNHFGHTPLHSVLNNHSFNYDMTEIVELLLKKDVNLNLKNLDKQTPYDMVCHIRNGGGISELFKLHHPNTTNENSESIDLGGETNDD